MKKILIIIAVLGFTACSSKEKNENKKTAVQRTETSKDQTKAKTATKKEAADSSQEDATDSIGGNFGPYEGTERSKFTCTSGNDVRIIAVLDGNNGGCGVIYNKMGNNKTIAVAEHNMEFCPEIQDKVKGNLEEANFTCE